MEKIYGPFTLADFKIGDRVEIHPATDLWMRGARVGVIIKIGSAQLTIKLDAWNAPVRFHAENIHAIIN